MKRIRREVIGELIQSEEFKSTGDVMEAIKAMFSDVLSEALEAELDTTLGYDKQERRTETEGKDNPQNYRNGHTTKTVKTQLGEVSVTVPRDRNGNSSARSLASTAAMRTAWKKNTGFVCSGNEPTGLGIAEHQQEMDDALSQLGLAVGRVGHNVWEAGGVTHHFPDN